MKNGFKKGVVTNPNGKKPGTLNKTTRDIKEAYKLLIEKNLDNLTLWLERVAEDDPSKAIRIVNDLSEYIIPKLARTELTGTDGKDLIPKISIELIDNSDKVDGEDTSSK